MRDHQAGLVEACLSQFRTRLALRAAGASRCPELSHTWLSPRWDYARTRSTTRSTAEAAVPGFDTAQTLFSDCHPVSHTGSRKYHDTFTSR